MAQGHLNQFNGLPPLSHREKRSGRDPANERPALGDSSVWFPIWLRWSEFSLIAVLKKCFQRCPGIFAHQRSIDEGFDQFRSSQPRRLDPENLIPGTRTATFLNLIEMAGYVPLSGVTMQFDGDGRCVAGCSRN
jgi:hypothetical protein